MLFFFFSSVEASMADKPHMEERSFLRTLISRLVWLTGLLVFQSASSFILEHHHDLLKRHLVVLSFLTMLVGAGGNSGAQAAVAIIQRIAAGRISSREQVLGVLAREALMGGALSCALFFVGLARVFLSHSDLYESLTIAVALVVIVFLSVVVGAALPLFFHFVLGIDPAHAGSSVQVIADIVGVATTCTIASIVLQ